MKYIAQRELSDHTFSSRRCESCSDQGTRPHSGRLRRIAPTGHSLASMLQITGPILASRLSPTFVLKMLVKSRKMLAVEKAAP